MIRALDDRSIPPALNDPVSKNPEELPAPPGRPDPEFAGNYRSQGNLPEPYDLAPVHGKDLLWIADVGDAPLYPYEYRQ